MQPKISVYIATSLDGFIARSDGGLDWLEHDSGKDDYGFYEFFGSVDTIVMGRGTFDFVVASGQWPYAGKRMIILSSTLTISSVPERLRGEVEILSIEPGLLAEKLAGEGATHVYVDGGITIQRFLRAGLVDELILSRMPVLLGSGIPLFGELDSDIALEHVETRIFDSGLVQSKYRRRDS
ncbi:MAG: dihydrofolate reductase family protein [Chloroflexi bacterium]|nr:dihydrofolate reductase family protein [Chloroflexota bacterium]